MEGGLLIALLEFKVTIWWMDSRSCSFSQTSWCFDL